MYVLAEMGLAPVHQQGAFGNHSYREGDGSFVITRTGMIPRQELVRENYCRVRYVARDDLFAVHGRYDPSSECFLHHQLYEHFPAVGIIMHGHSGLLNSYADCLDIPVTTREYPYGTRELGQAAVEMAATGASLFVLRNHGFVVVDRSIDRAVTTLLDSYGHLLDLLKRDAAAGL